MANRSRNALLCRGVLSISLCKKPDPIFAAPHVIVPLLIIVSLLVAGCGFEPVYSVRDNAGQTTPISKLDLPDTRAGRYLGNQLRGRFTSAETGGLALYVTLDEARRDALIATDGSTERIDLTMTANVRLENASGDIVETRALRVSSSYNRSSSELANQETEASLRNTALDRIASDIQFLLADLAVNVGRNAP